MLLSVFEGEANHSGNSCSTIASSELFSFRYQSFWSPPLWGSGHHHGIASDFALTFDLKRYSPDHLGLVPSLVIICQKCMIVRVQLSWCNFAPPDTWVGFIDHGVTLSCILQQILCGITPSCFAGNCVLMLDSSRVDIELYPNRSH